MTAARPNDVMAYYSAGDDFDAWRAALAIEGLDLCIADTIAEPETVRYASVWRPPPGFFDRFPNLELVVTLGAGVDALLGRHDLPNVPITRLADPKTAQMMSAYVTFAVTRYARDIPTFERARQWRFIHPRDPQAVSVGILGMGELGLVAALDCARLGYKVRGWSNSLKSVSGVETSAGLDALAAILAVSDIVVCMLPQTPQTIGLLDARRLGQMKRGAAFVNVSRGRIVDEAALIAALRSGHIAEATLDVFATEPLPSDSPLWEMENVLITPHVASRALPGSAARQIGENVRRLRAGETLLNRVDTAKGY